MNIFVAYVLNIFARSDDINQDQNDRKFLNVCSYMITSSQPAADPGPYPIISNGQLGPICNESPSFEIKPASHKAALIKIPDDGGQLDVTFNMSKFCKILPELKCYQDGCEKDMDGFTIVSGTSSDSATVSARFPEITMYILNIYGKNEETSSADSYKLAFRYMIQVNGVTNPCFQFPRQFSAWTPACQLVEPDITRPIFAESTIRFRAKISGALTVAVVKSYGSEASADTDTWTHLDTQDGEVWTGEVESGAAGYFLKLFVKFKKNTDAYSCALQFQVGIDMCDTLFQ